MFILICWFEIFFVLFFIKYFMKFFMFSYEFVNVVVFFMVVLFFGIGNYIFEVLIIIFEWLCISLIYGMWYFLDKESIVSNFFLMVVFFNFS